MAFRRTIDVRAGSLLLFGILFAFTSTMIRAEGDPKHWAFVSPVRPALPAVRESGLVRNPIDRFILARLEKEELRPSPEADRVTLPRRLSLDLIGLPPTPEEVDAFLADRSPTPTRSWSIACWPPRITASAGAGSGSTRLAMPTRDGYEKDKPRQVWFYRDWVINALNRDLPYDQFIIEQIAGDLLPGATQDQIVATGFLRNSMINEEGGVDPEQFRMEAMFDRMDAIGKGVLGLTIQCAQCHNHKYDPLTQEEYYRLFAFLNNDHEANVAVYTPDEQMKRAEICRQIREIEADLRHRHPDWRERMDRLGRERSRPISPKWTVVRPDVSRTSRPAAQKYLPHARRLVPGRRAMPRPSTPVKFTVKTDLHDDHGLSAGAAERPQPAAARAGPVDQGNGRLTEFEVEAAPGRRAGQAAQSSSPRPRPTSTRRRRRSRRSSTTRAARSGYAARSRSPSTARTTPPGASTSGPAGATCRARRSSSLEKPIAHRQGHDPDVSTWRRTTAAGTATTTRTTTSAGSACRSPIDPTPWPIRCRSGPRDPGDSRREAHAGAGRRRLQLLADDGPRVEGRQRPDRSAVEAASRRLDRSWCCRHATEPRTTASARSGATSSSRARR